MPAVGADDSGHWFEPIADHLGRRLPALLVHEGHGAGGRRSSSRSSGSSRACGCSTSAAARAPRPRVRRAGHRGGRHRHLPPLRRPGGRGRHRQARPSCGRRPLDDLRRRVRRRHLAVPGRVRPGGPRRRRGGAGGIARALRPGGRSRRVGVQQLLLGPLPGDDEGGATFDAATATASEITEVRDEAGVAKAVGSSTPPATRPGSCTCSPSGPAWRRRRLERRTRRLPPRPADHRDPRVPADRQPRSRSRSPRSLRKRRPGSSGRGPPPFVEPRVHGRHERGVEVAVLGEVDASAGVDHHPVEAAEQPGHVGGRRRARRGRGSSPGAGNESGAGVGVADGLEHGEERRRCRSPASDSMQRRSTSSAPNGSWHCHWTKPAGAVEAVPPANMSSGWKNAGIDCSSPRRCLGALRNQSSLNARTEARLRRPVGRRRDRHRRAGVVGEGVARRAVGASASAGAKSPWVEHRPPEAAALGQQVDPGHRVAVARLAVLQPCEQVVEVVDPVGVDDQPRRPDRLEGEGGLDDRAGEAHAAARWPRTPPGCRRA